MDEIIEKCREDGVSAGTSAMAARDAPLAEETVKYFQKWKEGLSSEPTDEMTAAWLIGFSWALARFFSLFELQG